MTSIPSGQDGSPGSEPDGASQQSPPAAVDAAGTPDAPAAPAPPADKTYTKAEYDEVVASRHAAKERARTADEQVAALNQQLGGMPPAEELEAFRTWKSDKAARERDKAIEKGDLEAIEKGIRGPLEEQIAGKDTRITGLESQLTIVLRDQALLKAATAHNAIDPETVVALLRNRVKMEPTDDGRFVPSFLDEQGKALYDGKAQRVTDADTFVKLYLANPKRSYLVRTTVAPDSGAKRHGGGTDAAAGQVTTLDQYKALTPDQQVKALETMTDENLRAIITSGKPPTHNIL